MGAACLASVVVAATACGAARSGNAPPATGVPVAAAAARPAAARLPAELVRATKMREGATLAIGAARLAAAGPASAGQKLLYIADEDEHLLRVVDVATAEELGATPLDGRPAQLLVLADGSIAVAMRDRARVDVFTATAGLGQPFTVRASVPVAAEPVGLATSPDDSTLLVASGWGRALTLVDTATMTVREKLPLSHEARAVAATADGRRAYVAHPTGGVYSVLEPQGNLRTLKWKGSEDAFLGAGDAPTELGGRVGGQSFTLVRGEGLTEGRLFVPQTMAFAGDPTLPSVGYGGDGSRLSAHVFNVALLDESTARPEPRSVRLAGDSDLEIRANEFAQAAKHRCLLPRGAALYGRELFVTCLGIDAVVALDATSVRPRQAERRRFSVPEGPTGIAVDDGAARAYVWSQFARAVSVIDLSGQAGGEARYVQSAPLPHRRPAVADDPVVAAGRRLFHGAGDLRISSDGRACASCHPDGRDDGLVWSTPNGPRQTPMLAGRTDKTGPYSWIGDAKSVSDHLEHTLARLGGKGLARDEREAIGKYLSVMSAPPAAAPAADPKVERGAAIFASAEAACASCHGARGDDPDGLTHDVGSRAAGDKHKEFDTPSLRFLAGSGPYFHDGRYGDLRTLLKKTDGKMGKTSHLAAADVDALEAFLRSL